MNEINRQTGSVDGAKKQYYPPPFFFFFKKALSCVGKARYLIAVSSSYLMRRLFPDRFR